MNKRYKEIEFLAGDTVEDAVKELLSYKDKGMLVCATFNGVTLYSDTVTMDGAYKEITGKTKTEFDKEQEDWRENLKKEEQEYKERVPELSEIWIQKGKEVLTEDKWSYWEEIVPVRLNDLYHGMELGCCLDIVKILNNNGTLQEAKEKIESQDHSGMSFGLVCAMVKEFCLRGNEFVEYVR
jgi:predicted nuclease with TOPRIM domain